MDKKGKKDEEQTIRCHKNRLGQSHVFHKGIMDALRIPIMVEQMLNSLMGMADTMMVSNVGSVAMSAVSLVDSINTLCDPGVCSTCHRAAIICSHYLGKGDERRKQSGEADFPHRDRDFFNDHGRRTDLLPTVVTSDFWAVEPAVMEGFHYLFPDHGIFLSVYCPV